MIYVRSSFLIFHLKALTADSADLMDLCSLDQIKGLVYLTNYAETMFSILDSINAFKGR